MSYRTPPKPLHYDTAPPGTCRWCNELIGLTKTGRQSKSRWHEACGKEYEILNFVGETRKAVWKRDQGKCAACGVVCDRKGKNGWDMDHIKPLIEAKGDLAYWRLPNLQTLCKACHIKKTSAEATQRAEMRRKEKGA